MEVEDGEILEDGEINDEEEDDACNQENKAPAFEVPEQVKAEDEAADGKKDKKKRKHREKREKKRKEKSKDQSAAPGTKKRKHKHYTDYDRVEDSYVWPTSAVGTHHGQAAPEAYESLFDLPQEGVGEHEEISQKMNMPHGQQNHATGETAAASWKATKESAEQYKGIKEEMAEAPDIKRSHSYDEITPRGGVRKRQDMAVSPGQDAEGGQEGGAGKEHYRRRGGGRKDDYGMDGSVDPQTDGSPSKKSRHTLTRHVSNPAESRTGWKNTPFDSNKSGSDYHSIRDARQQRHRRHSRHKEHTHSSDVYADPYDAVYQSPPGPYDSPAESPPGPYDSPPPDHERKDRDDYHHDDMDAPGGRSSLLGMIGDQFVDPNIAANEREEIFKTASRKKKGQKWTEQQRSGKQQKKGLLDPPTKQRARCMFFMENKCQKGNRCPFNHDFTPTKRPEICKYYVQSTCFKGDDCIFMHGEYPCKFYHTGGKCYANENCKFSHDRLTDETRQLLEKVLDHGEDAWKDHAKRFPGGGGGERRERHDRNDRHGDDGRPGYQGDEGARQGYQGDENRPNYQSDEGRPRPSLLGSPPRSIPSLLDIEVFPIPPKSSPLRPGGFYKDTSSGPSGPQGPGPGMGGPQGSGPGMDGPQGHGPGGMGGPQGPGMDGPQGRGPGGMGGAPGPGMDGPQGHGPGGMGGPQGPGIDGPQGHGIGGPGMDGPPGRGPGMGGHQGPGMDGPGGMGGPQGHGMDGPQGHGPGIGGSQGSRMDGPQGCGSGMGGPQGPGMDGPQGRGPGMGGPHGHGGMGGPMMQGPGMGGSMIQGPGMGGPQGPGSMHGPSGPGGNIGIQGLSGPSGNMGMQGQSGPGGNMGMQGPSGPGGNMGMQGPSGPGGNMGMQGPSGPGGNMGMQGPSGPGGNMGMQGPSGPCGNMGIQGPPGQGGMRILGDMHGSGPVQGHNGPGGMQGTGQGPMSRQQGPGGMSPMQGGQQASGGPIQMQNQGPMQGPGGGNRMQGMGGPMGLHGGGQGPGFMQGPGQHQFQSGIPTPQQQLQAQQTGGSGMGPNFPGSGMGPFQPGSGPVHGGQMGPGGGGGGNMSLLGGGGNMSQLGGSGGGVQLLGPAVSSPSASGQMGRPSIDVVQGAQALFKRLFGSENQSNEVSQQALDIKPQVADDSHEPTAAASADEDMSSQDESAPDLKIATNSSLSDSADETHSDPKLDADGDSPKKSPGGGMDIPTHLPRKQRELFMRIQQQQQEKVAEEAEMKEDEADTQPVDDDNWQYSSDEEESASDHSKSMISNILKSISKKLPASSATAVGMEKSRSAPNAVPVPAAVVSAAQNPAFDIMKMLNAIKQQATGASTADVAANSSSVPSIPVIIQPDSQPELRSPTSKGGLQFLGLSRSLAKNGELPYKLVEISPRSKPYYYSCMPPGLDLNDARVKKDPRIARILKHLPQSDPRGAQRRPSSTGQDSPRASDPRLGRQDSSGSAGSVGSGGLSAPFDPRVVRSQSASDNQTAVVCDPRKASPSHQQTDPRLATAALDPRSMTGTSLVSAMSDTGISGIAIDSKLGLITNPTIGNIILGPKVCAPNSDTMNQMSDPRIGPPLSEPLPLALTRLPGGLLNAKLGLGPANTPSLTPMPSLPSLPFPPPQNFPGSNIMNPAAFLTGENRMSFDPRLRGALTQAQLQLQQHHQQLQQQQLQQLQQQKPPPSQSFPQQQQQPPSQSLPQQQQQPPSQPFPQQQQQPPSQPFPQQQIRAAAAGIDPRLQRSQSNVTLGTHNLPVRPLDPRVSRSSGLPEVRAADPRVSRKPSGESLNSSDSNTISDHSQQSNHSEAQPWNPSITGSRNPSIVEKSANLSTDLLTSISTDPRLGRGASGGQTSVANADSMFQQQQVPTAGQLTKSEEIDQVSVVPSDPRSRKQELLNSAADPLESRSSRIQQTNDSKIVRTHDGVDSHSVLDLHTVVNPCSVVVDPCQARTENLSSSVSDPRLSKSQENKVSSDITELTVSGNTDASISDSATCRLDPRMSRRQVTADKSERVNTDSETDSCANARQSDGNSTDPRRAAQRTQPQGQHTKTAALDSVTMNTSDADATSSNVVHTNNNNNENSSSSKSRIPKKKFTGKRKSSMEYSSPLGMGSDDPDPTVSGFSSYNRAARESVKSHENWNTSIVSPPNAIESNIYPSPPHSVMEIIDPSSSQDNQMEIMDLSTTQPPLKDLFKTIDPTASPFC